jgi:hypothetical protein
VNRTTSLIHVLVLPIYCLVCAVGLRYPAYAVEIDWVTVGNPGNEAGSGAALSIGEPLTAAVPEPRTLWLSAFTASALAMRNRRTYAYGKERPVRLADNRYACGGHRPDILRKADPP